MPQVKYAGAAISDLQRLRAFLQPKHPIAAKRASDSIMKAMQVLGQQPQIGGPVEGLPEVFREWLINFGDSGYVARYRYDGDAVVILAVRYQKEVGY